MMNNTKYSLIDSHCHLTFEQYVDIEAVLKKSIDAGIDGWITIGTDIPESSKAVELASRFENIYATAAIHPHDAKSADSKAINKIKELSQNNKVVAIGETGLDFHYDFSTPWQQKDCFERHLEIASELNLPVVIHSREAFEDTVKILDKFSKSLKKVVFHCYSGSVEQAKLVLDKGWHISLTGVVTFKNAIKTQEVAKLIPIERLMIETDCPYMSPEPMRKQRVNEPALMIHTAKFIAHLKNMPFEQFACGVTNTTIEFFNLPS